ncbi:MAG: RecQ family zinc-binding domain-containing protein, partial [Candidatus Hydrogenedentes bacterium]|nr:RecQ family zinc-binding domain-containing protein [Candidatus Hydrogenedentota bacterium]
FLKKIFRFAKKAKIWFTLDTTIISEAIGEPRDRIVAALNYLEEKGDLILQVAGVRQGYRRLRQPDDIDALVASLNERFQQREANDIARIQQVIAFAQHDGCLTQYLLAYFGEERDACGHCVRCKGVDLAPMAATIYPEIGEGEGQRIRGLINEGHDALVTPRQRARFLCGITSPATTRAKLRKHPLFGVCDSVPFAKVMTFVADLG